MLVIFKLVNFHCMWSLQMVMLYKDPNGEKIFASASASSWSSSARRKSEQVDDTELSTLRKRVTELELTLTQIRVKIILVEMCSC